MHRNGLRVGTKRNTDARPREVAPQYDTRQPGPRKSKPIHLRSYET
jgi:hypothetical protein